jgi:Tat protein translocase TatB subunit
MFNIGPQELLLILVLALLVVGPQRLPEIARTIGKGVRELRKAQDEVRKTISVNLDEPSTATTRTPPRLPVDADPDVDGSIATGEASDPADAASGPVSATDASAAAAASAAGLPAEASSGVNEVSRSLGRTLAELRRAREEVQRSFRLDPDVASSSPTKADRSTPRGSATDPARSATEDGPASPPDDVAGRDGLDRPA